MTIPKVLTEQELNLALKSLDDYTAAMKKAGYTTQIGKTANGKPALSLLWKQGTWNFLTNFSMNDVDGHPYLSIVSAKGLTTGVLLSELKAFESNAMRSQRLWDPTTWGASQVAPEPPK